MVAVPSSDLVFPGYSSHMNTSITGQKFELLGASSCSVIYLLMFTPACLTGKGSVSIGAFK